MWFLVSSSVSRPCSAMHTDPSRCVQSVAKAPNGRRRIFSADPGRRMSELPDWAASSNKGACRRVWCICMYGVRSTTQYGVYPCTYSAGSALSCLARPKVPIHTGPGLSDVYTSHYPTLPIKPSPWHPFRMHGMNMPDRSGAHLSVCRRGLFLFRPFSWGLSCLLC